jgi:hypothetical protein
MADVADQHSLLKLRALEPRDSANLLLEDAGIAVNPSLLDHGEELVECVCRLPLATVHTASSMKQTPTALDKMPGLYRN